MAAVVAWGGAFAVVLAGLTAVGATDAEAASGLLALSVGMGVLTVWLALSERIPVTIAWSTPGAALLVSAGAVEGGWPAAVGAFAGHGRAAGAHRPVAAAGTADRRDPRPDCERDARRRAASVCLAPVRFAADAPLSAAPIFLTWAVLLRFARRWAIPGALVAAALVVAVDPSGRDSGIGLLPEPVLTSPVFEPGALVGLALPLFIVTMASQNVTGMTVLATTATGRACPACWPGPARRRSPPRRSAATRSTSPRSARRSRPAPRAGATPRAAGSPRVAAGVTYVALGLGAGLITAFAAAAPPR